jgi:hypothetical protein
MGVLAGDAPAELRLDLVLGSGLNGTSTNHQSRR